MMEADRSRAVRRQGTCPMPARRPCAVAARAAASCWAASASPSSDRGCAASSGRAGAAQLRLGCRRPIRLNAATMAAIAAGVSTRRYAGTLDELPPPEKCAVASKSAVSRRFVALSTEQLHEWLSRPLDELDLPVVMIDGIHFRDRVILVALGIDAQGNKHVLGLREGSHREHARGALAAVAI